MFPTWLSRFVSVHDPAPPVGSADATRSPDDPSTATHSDPGTHEIALKMLMAGLVGLTARTDHEGASLKGRADTITSPQIESATQSELDAHETLERSLRCRGSGAAERDHTNDADACVGANATTATNVAAHTNQSRARPSISIPPRNAPHPRESSRERPDPEHDAIQAPDTRTASKNPAPTLNLPKHLAILAPFQSSPSAIRSVGPTSLKPLIAGLGKRADRGQRVA